MNQLTQTSLIGSLHTISSEWSQRQLNFLSQGPLKIWTDYTPPPPNFTFWNYNLSGGFWVRPAQRKVVKIKNFDFSYWASSTPWGHVLSLKTFCRNPALSWAIKYSVFQKVKFTSSFEFVCGNPFSTFWHQLQTTYYSKFDLLKNWVPDCSAQDRISAKSF